jgi:hypothetical protein
VCSTARQQWTCRFRSRNDVTTTSEATGGFTPFGYAHRMSRVRSIVGTGIDNAELGRLWRRLQPLAIDTMPLDVPPPRGSRFGSPLVLSRVHWVRPELVAEVKFLTWTEDNLLRQVVYEGLREDKPAAEVRREHHQGPQPVKEARPAHGPAAETHPARRRRSPGGDGRGVTRSPNSRGRR